MEVTTWSEVKKTSSLKRLKLREDRKVSTRIQSRALTYRMARSPTRYRMALWPPTKPICYFSLD